MEWNLSRFTLIFQAIKCEFMFFFTSLHYDVLPFVDTIFLDIHVIVVSNPFNIVY